MQVKGANSDYKKMTEINDHNWLVFIVVFYVTLKLLIIIKNKIKILFFTKDEFFVSMKAMLG